MNKKILVFIPAKNESATIHEVIHDSFSVIKKAYQIEPDVLVIDDGSTDNTKAIALKAGAQIIRHKKSIGLGQVFRKAAEFAIKNKYDLLVTIDGDNQFNATEIPKLIKPIINDEADFTSGNRFSENKKIEHMSNTKRIGNSLVAKIVNYILDSQYTDVSCGFRVYNKEALLNLNLLGGYTYTQEVFLNLGFKKLRIVEVPIDVTYFPTRKSRIASNVLSYGINVSKIILSSLIYYKPLKFFGTISTLLWLVSIPTLAILSWRYIQTGLISPFKAVGILSISGIFLGILLLTIGVILYALSHQKLSIDKLLYYARQKQD